MLIFLLWIWGRSMHDYGILVDVPPKSQREKWTLYLMDARLIVEKVKPEAGYDLPTYFTYSARSFWNFQTTEGAPWFPSPAFEHSRKDTFIPPDDSWADLIPTVTETWDVAWWVLVAAYLLPWLALSAWRARRIAKIRRAAVP